MFNATVTSSTPRNTHKDTILVTLKTSSGKFGHYLGGIYIGEVCNKNARENAHDCGSVNISSAPYIGIVSPKMPAKPYSQHFIFFVTYEWAQ
jgi:hypothetical protein